MSKVAISFNLSETFYGQKDNWFLSKNGVYNTTFNNISVPMFWSVLLSRIIAAIKG